jgi:polyhydroxyalkanoate synthesis regulator phasin
VAVSVERTLQRLNIPTRHEMEELQRKIKTLSQRVKKLEEALKASSEEAQEKE